MGHTDEDGETDSMAAQPQTPTSSKMPHVEMVAPKQTQEDLDKKEEKPGKIHIILLFLIFEKVNQSQYSFP